MTKREAAIVSAYTGYLVGTFEDMHDYADELIPGITTYGLAMFHNGLQEKARADFLALEVK